MVSVLEDLLLNLATALFIQEQGNSNLKTVMGTISSQHIWNFKPCLLSTCCVLDILDLVMSQTKSVLIGFPRITGIFEKQIVPTLS